MQILLEILEVSPPILILIVPAFLIALFFTLQTEDGIQPKMRSGRKERKAKSVRARHAQSKAVCVNLAPDVL